MPLTRERQPIAPAPVRAFRTAEPAAGDVQCAICGGHRRIRLRTAAETAADLGRALARGAKLMHSYPADVFVCETCRTVYRDPARVPDDLSARYRDDSYPLAELERLWACGLAALRRDTTTLFALGLEPRSQVLEVGSYVGSFLTLARELGCDARGVDIGREVAAFARSRGLRVADGTLSADRFGPARFDSVWILNCFEQLPDSRAVLGDVAAVLRPGGRIVIRTPNAEFIRVAYHFDSKAMRAVLDANGLLGVPFLKCLTADGVVGLLAGNGFGRFRLHGHELSAAGPPGYPSWWSGLGCVRRAGFELASRRARTLLYPWMYVSAVKSPSPPGARPRG